MNRPRVKPFSRFSHGGMPSKPVVAPRHLQPPPDPTALDDKFAELPLLVDRPGQQSWSLDLDKTVSIFLPVNKKHGIGAQGTLIDGNMDSNIMRLFQSFVFALTWSEPRRWNEMKCMVAVLHRDSPDGVQNEKTQLGVLLLFQHEDRTFRKKKTQSETVGDAMEEADEGPGEEPEMRRLPRQLDLNFEDLWDFLHANPIQSTSSMPSAKFEAGRRLVFVFLDSRQPGRSQVPCRSRQIRIYAPCVYALSWN